MGDTNYYAGTGTLFSTYGRLNTWDWVWETCDPPDGIREVTALEALEFLAGTPNRRRIPVGVIGPREATEEQIEAAKTIGAELGRLGLTMICGGKSGVMSAAAEGCLSAGGLTVGLIPDHTWRTANPFIALPIATGLSEGRNMVIAKSCEVLIAIGGSYGTLSEIAYGLHFSKPVIGLCGAPAIEGLEQAGTPKDAMARMAAHLLSRAQTS